MSWDPQALPFSVVPPPPRRPVAGRAVRALAFLGFGLVVGGMFSLLGWRMYQIRGMEAANALSATMVLWWATLGGMLIAVLGAKLRWWVDRWGRRMVAEDALALLRRDPRPPVLFLRSFDDDDMPDTTFGNTKGVATHEERLARVLGPLGPTVAVGRPGEPVPELGFARFYVEDADWRAAVAHCLEHAALVVILVGRSRGVRWEVEEALRRVPRERLLLFFPHVLSRKRRGLASVLRGSFRVRYSTELVQEMSGEREERYRAFLAGPGRTLAGRLPTTLERAVFVDFPDGDEPRLLAAKAGRRITLDRENLRVQLDHERTLRPVLDRLLGRRSWVSPVEWALTSPAILKGLVPVLGVGWAVLTFSGRAPWGTHFFAVATAFLLWRRLRFLDANPEQQRGRT